MAMVSQAEEGDGAGRNQQHGDGVVPRGGGHVANHGRQPLGQEAVERGPVEEAEDLFVSGQEHVVRDLAGQRRPEDGGVAQPPRHGTYCRHGRYRGDPWCCRAQSAAGGERHDRERQAEPDGFHARQVGKREQNSEANDGAARPGCRGGHEQARGHAEDGERQG